jgi:hypothetical protein
MFADAWPALRRLDWQVTSGTPGAARTRQEVPLARADDCFFICSFAISAETANRSEVNVLITVADRRLDGLPASSIDIAEAIDRYDKTGRLASRFEDLLTRRISQWEAQSAHTPTAHRPTKWDRRVLLWRVLHAFDGAGIPRSYDRNKPRVLGLRVVLQIADRIDKLKKPTQGSLRIVESVCRDYRERHSWKPSSVNRHLYEARGWWPPLVA